MDTMYQIGDWVEVKSRVEFYYDKDRMRKTREAPYDEPWKGQVVGVATRMLGQYYPPETSYSPSYDSMTDYGEYEPAYLTWEKTVRVWLVRRGMINLPVEVSSQGLEITTPEEQLPWMWTNPLRCTKEYRSMLSRESRDWPRDEKGRWISFKKGK
jgi:hypothetical protein